MHEDDNDKSAQEMRRNALLQQIVVRMELPMVILGFAWLALLIVDFVRGLSPLLQFVSTVIWMIFVLDFVLELTVAPQKRAYLKRNWLMVLALFVPALRIFRLLQLFQVLQGARLVRVLSSLSRAMRALSTSLGRHGFRYVAVLTIFVTFAGAAGMYAFERNPAHGHGLQTYPDALWWTAMIMATLGSGYWPQTAEGRVLCLILSLYAFSVFGYVTAALATFLVGREAGLGQGDLAGAKEIVALRDEIVRLRDEIRDLAERISAEKK